MLLLVILAVVHTKSLRKMTAVSLNSGASLPSIGLGLWKIPKEDAANAVVEAIRVGYRHLDSACDYGNEVEVGAGIAQAISEGLCKREDLWITSKLWNTYHDPEHVGPALERTLSDLGVDYLDLYLIHFPIALRYVPFEKRYPPEWFYDPDAKEPAMQFAQVSLADTWFAMEKLVDAGKVNHIGVCNYGVSLMRDLRNYARIQPSVLQIESHPYLTQEALIRYCHDNRIAVTAFSPLAALSYVELGMAGQADSVLSEACVVAAANRLGKTPAQVVLRWGTQRGTAVIPKTTKPERLIENADVFDFELSEAEMTAISGLNQNRRFNDPGVFCEAAFNTACPIYE